MLITVIITIKFSSFFQSEKNNQPYRLSFQPFNTPIPRVESVGTQHYGKAIKTNERTPLPYLPVCNTLIVIPVNLFHSPIVPLYL